MRVQLQWTLHRPGVKSRQRALLPHHGDSSPFRLQQLWSSRFFSIFFLVPTQQHGLSYILFLQRQEATGWADFEAFSGGGEGMEGKMEQMESIPRISRRLVLKRSRAIEAAVVRRTSRGKASTRRDAGGCGRGGEEDW